MSLTPRRREIVAHLANGLSIKESARRLGLSPHTVNRLRAAAYSSLGVHNRADLTRAAIRLGVI